MAEKIKDGPVLMYVLDGVLYPVGLTKEQHMTVSMMSSVLGELHVMTDKPQGVAHDFAAEKG